MSQENSDESKLPQWQSAAETILTNAWGGPVRLSAPELLRKPGYRNQIVRFTVADASPNSPTTVIVKIAQSTAEEPYNAESDNNKGSAWRLRNDASGNTFLNRVSADASPLSGVCWGGDVGAGLFALEDLGKPNSLADAMQQNDPAVLRDALFRYAKGLGKLHAATIGRENEFFKLRAAEFGGTSAVREPMGEQLHAYARDFCEIAEAQGVAIPSAWHEEIKVVAELMDNPGPYLAFTPGDTCPDNHRLMEDGSFRFFDFEFAAFRHALLDAAYLCVPFPTCWCVNRLPSDLAGDLIKAYRAELAPACPDAHDDRQFMVTLAAACAHWTTATLAWSAKGAIEKDGDWGIATVRQRIPFRLENLARIAEQTQTLPVMAEVARALAEKFRALWPETGEMPLYAAFRAENRNL